MRFSRIEIQGFKSFVERHELFFHEGLMGVVGPNGCGKSNIVEAIRWVMGESSARKMRAQSMDDVIFSGTENRPKRNFAQVTLFIDNQDFSLPEKYNDKDEVIISRKIERNAGSTYFINGKEVRARDTQLFFADAGVGAHASTHVSQGHVAEIINQRPQERRLLLEEAAGISGLRQRRREAELKLKQTQENLQRIDDIANILKEQNQSLQSEVEKVIKYRTLSTDIHSLQGKRLYAEYISLKGAEARHQKNLEKSQTSLVSKQESLAAMSGQLEAHYQNQEKLQQENLHLQGMGKTAEIELAHFDKTTEQRREQYQNFQTRLKEIDAQLTEDTERKQRALTQCENLKNKIATTEHQETCAK